MEESIRMAAFDKHLLGVQPDFHIIVRTDLLQEIDGPMLKYGIQELHGQKLILPHSKKQWPDINRLEKRYNDFKNVG